jgi:hypothetical protein
MAFATWLLPVPALPTKIALLPSVINFSVLSSKQVRFGICAYSVDRGQ